MSSADEDTDQMIADCEAREAKLSEWEQEFVDSLSTQLRRGRSLTEKQQDTLTKIWDRVTR